MSTVIKSLKKVFTFSVVTTTILWSSMVSVLVPSMVSAANCPAGFGPGTMLKVTGRPPVYIMNNQQQLLSYFSGNEYKTWTSNNQYSGHLYVSQACFDEQKLPTVLPTLVGFRPGTKIVKRIASDQLYVVEPGNKLAKITPAAATALYGAYTAYTVDDVAFPHYVNRGDDITTAVPHEGMLVSNGGKTYYVSAGSTLQEVTDSGFSANNFQRVYVHAVASTAGFTMGAPISAQVAALVDRTQGGGLNTPVATTGGDLTVSLAATNPGATNLPSGTAFNEVLRVSFSAGSQGATITGLTLQKSGYMANTGISGIDVIDGNGVRHGNVVSSVNSDNQVVVLFGSTPVVVPANGTVVLTVRVNLGATATSGTLKMGVAKVETTSSVSGSFPIYGNEFTNVNGSTAVASSSIDVRAISGALGATLNADSDNAQEITKFRISELASQEDLKVYKLTLFNLGSAADTDYKDVQLVANDGNVLATAQPKSQYVVFDLSASPYTILKGQYKDLTVRAKIVSGAGTSKYIQFVVYNDYDLEVRGATTGAYVLPTGGTTDGGGAAFPVGDNSTYNRVTIGTGSLSFNKDAGSYAGVLTPGQTSVELAKYYVKPTGENMELRTLNFGILQYNGSALTGNVFVRVDGSNVWSGAASGFAAAGTAVSVPLNSYPTLTSGKTSYITVEASIPSTATSGVYYTVKSMDITSVKKVLSNTITDPTVSPADGNQLNVKAASLLAKTLATPVARSIVPVSNGVSVATFELVANTSGEDVRVSSVVVNNTITGASTDVTGLKLYNGADQLLTTNNTDTNGASTTFTFTNPLIVPKGGYVNLTLKVNVISGTTSTHTFNLGVVTATGKDTGTDVTVTPTGAGQTMTITASPTAILSLSSGTGLSPSTAQVQKIGAKDGTYFAFKVTPANEGLKLRTLILTATGTVAVKDVRNIRLYRNSETVPFSTVSEPTCAAAGCVATFTDNNNLLDAALPANTPTTISVKADIGEAGAAKLGDNFRFIIAATSTDFLAVGESSSASVVVNSSAPAVSSLTYIVPFNVTVSGVSPLVATTGGLSAGQNIGVFKVTNIDPGTSITLTNVKMTDGGASTSTMLYKLWSSTEKSPADVGASGTGGSSDHSLAASTTVAKSANFGAITDQTLTLAGGNTRYLTIQTNATAVNNDTFQMSVAALGDLKFKVNEQDLGYDGNVDGTTDNTDITGLYVGGTPGVEVFTAKT